MKIFILLFFSIFFLNIGNIATSQVISTKILNKTEFIKKNSITTNKISPNYKTSKTWDFIIAPHPDDEILCCSNLISQKLQEGKNIKIVYLTNGDGLNLHNYTESRKYGLQRKKESIKAISELGVSPKNTIFLGFPDDGLSKLATNIFVSPYTDLKKTQSTTFFPRTDYTKFNLSNSLYKIFREFPPNEIFVTSTKDSHPDHKIAENIVKEVLKKNNIFTDLFTYQIHNLKNMVKNEDQKKVKRKKFLINFFESQFHDENHQKYLEKFAYFLEKFTRIKI